jgi:hypothetical protein
VSVAAAAEYLGHSPSVLLATYAHLMPADHERAQSVVQSAFDRDLVCHTRVTPEAEQALEPWLDPLFLSEAHR